MSDYLNFKQIPDEIRTRRLAENQEEYETLDILDRPFSLDEANDINQMVCFLDFTPEQRRRIAAGENISIGILGVKFQPIQVKIEEIPQYLTDPQKNWRLTMLGRKHMKPKLKEDK